MVKTTKWLLRKVSGSRAKFTVKPDYCETRYKKHRGFETLPMRESMSKSKRTYLDTSLIYRWLHSQVGKPFDVVYSEYLRRIQPKYLHSHRQTIFCYVDQPSMQEFDEGKAINSRMFYIDPHRKILNKYPQETKRRRGRGVWLKVKLLYADDFEGHCKNRVRKNPCMYK